MSDQAPGSSPTPPEKKSSRFKLGSKKDPTKAPTDKKSSPLMQRNVLAAAATALFAIVGVLLLVSYIQGEERDAAAARAVGPVIIASAPIESGTTLAALLAEDPSRISTQELPVDAIAAGAFTSMDQLSTYEDLQAIGELMLNANLSTGEQLLSARVAPTESFSRRVAPVSIPADHHQLTMTLPPNRALGGLVRAGDKVSVVASFAAASGFETTTAMILSSVEVVNVQVENAAGPQVVTSTDEPLIAPSGAYLITVAVTPDELTKLAYTMEYGRITLAAAADRVTDGETYAQVLDTVLNSPSASPDAIAAAALAFEGDLLGNDPAAPTPSDDVEAQVPEVEEDE